jgi:integrase
MRDFASVKKWDSQPKFKFVVTYRQAGKRQARYFKDEKTARAFASEKTIELRNEGHRHGELSYDERQAVLVARQVGVNLRAAVDHYAAYLESLNHSAIVESAVEEFLAIRQAEGKSQAHLADLRQRLARFVRAYGTRLAASISTREIDGWLHGLVAGPQTRMNFRRILHNFFAFCAARGYCASNPVTQASKPKVPPKAIGILSVIEAQLLLSACPPSILPAVAIGMFAGLRASEIARLDWSSIDMNRGFIEVAAKKSKTAQRRLVTIPENLHAWLAPFAQESEPVSPSASTYQWKFMHAWRAAGIEHWPHNGLRHSFASYHLAQHQDAAKTALQLGHTESRTLFAHYRELVKPEDAKAFWKIFPA